MALACAALALLGLLAHPSPAAAQTVTTFISNTGQTSTLASSLVQATEFTTGTGTYTLSSVGIFIPFSVLVGTPAVKIYGDTGGTPGTLLATMTNPGTFADNAVHTFTAPANTTLSASTTYWLVTSNSAATNGQGFRVGVVGNTTLDSGAAAGWSIGAARLKNDIANTSWTPSSRRIRFAIRGTSGTTPNNPPTVANTIPDQAATAGTAFSYAFPANTFSDADTSDTLTYTATKADDTALPTWLAFAAGTRTFSGTPTAAGTVAVKVTASDGNGGSVSDEFDITVAADPNAHCNALDTSELWCGTLTVGVSNVAYGYNALLSFGSVAPLTFTHGGATITVNRLLYAGSRFQFGMSSALGAGDFSLEIGTGGAKRSFAMHNPGIEADFFNHGLSWSANETVPVKLLLVNTPATGAPAITGTAQVGQTLTATVGDIADVDGLPDPFLTDANTSFQWIRVATDNSETDIGAMAGAYTLVADDQGTTIKVKVSFTGNNGFAETRTSAATAAVAAAPDTTPPTLTSATVLEDGDIIELKFSENLLQSSWALSTTFTVTAAGSAVTVDTVLPAVAPLHAFWILVTPAIFQGQVVVVTYTDPTAGNDHSAIQDTAGNDVDTFTTGMDGVPAVTNNSTQNSPATGAPTITGTAQVGQTLTAVTTAIMDANGLTNVSYTYQWIRVATDNTETNISGATASTHTLVADDLGTTIKVTVSFTDDASNAETLTSVATAAVSAAANTLATGAPTITGTAQVGQTLTAVTTAIMDADGLTSVSYTYQWIRVDGGTETNIAGATASTYTLVTADQGTTIKVKVSFTDDLNNPETLTSAAAPAVAAAPDTTPPTLTSADVEETDVLIIDLDFSEDLQLSNRPAVSAFTVTVDGSAATVSSVLVPGSVLPQNQLWLQLSTAIRQGQAVVVTYTDPTSGNDTNAIQDTAGNDAADFTTGMDGVPTVTNNSTVNTPATGAPTITGTAQVGQTLTAGTTAIMDANGLTSVSYAYQWIRVATDNTETTISGATASTYTLVTADQGKTIKVKVSFTDDASNAEALTSAATAAVSAAANNLATGAPTITGTAQVGQMLTAGTTAIMDADGLTSPTYTYEWIRVDGGTETNISGATASAYTLVAADQGTTIKVKVSFTDDASNAETLTSTATAAVSAAPNTLPSASDGTVTTNEDTARTFAASEFNFSDADGDTLSNVRIVTLPASGKGTLALSGTPVTANQVVAVTNIGDLAYTPPANANGTGYASFTFKVSDGTAESEADYTMTITVTAVNDAPTVANAIPNRSATVGTAFSYGFPANTFSDADTGATLSYTATKADGATLPAWLSFAATRTFSGTPQTADVGTVSVKVTASDGNGGSGSGEFDITVSAAANNLATGAPTITGTAQVGQTLTAVTTGIMDDDGLTSVSYAYQWIRVDGGAETNISGATASTYTPVAADRGKTVKVKVSFTDDASNPETLTSTATEAVSAAPNTPATGAPTITGAAQVGRTLTAVTTAIMDADGLDNVSYTYQWIRVATDNTETNIGGAMARTYTPVADDLGATIKVTVSFTDDAGYAETRTGAATAAVTAATNTPATDAPPPPPTNTPPEMATRLVDQEATTGASFTYVIPADAFTDADGDRLTYAAVLSDGGPLPAWLTFDPATRTFTGTPGPGDGGTVRVTVTASDGTATMSDEFTLTVTVRNTPPEVANPLADQATPVDVPFTYVIPADAFTDADGDPLRYAAATRDGGGLPAWLAFNAATRTFTGIPAAGDSGTVRVTVTANDGTATVSDEFALRVLVVVPSTLRAWTSRFGRTVATHVTDAVGERLRALPGEDSHVTVGGYRLPLGRQAAGAADPDATEPETAMEPETATKPEPATDRLASLLTGLVGRALGLAAPQGGDGTDPRVDRLEPDPRLGQSQPLQLPTIRLRDVLLGSSFRLALGDDEAAPGHRRLTAWGRVAGTQFNGRDGALTLDGNVLTGTVGVDSAWDRWLAGVAVSHSLGGGSFTGDGDGDFDSSTLTSIHPYLRYAVNERVEVWSVLGYGWGDMTLEPGTGGTLETDTTLLMGSFGGRGILLSAPDNAGFQLAARTDAMLTRTTSGAVAGLAATDAEADRLRLVLEGTREVTWPEGQRVTPTVELGVRHDSGDAETGFGLELGGRVHYADPSLGLTIEVAVRGLLAHEDSDYKEWGASGTIRIDPGPTGQGFSLTLAPTWGAASSGIESLWSRQTTAGLAPQGTRSAPTGRLNAEVSYGVAAPFGTGLLTPYVGTVLTDGAARTYRVGTRLKLTGGWTTGVTLSLEGQRQEPVGSQPINQGLQFQAAWGF